jgi:hypothetical protein
VAAHRGDGRLITTQIPLDSEFQIFVFNTRAKVVEGTGRQWSRQRGAPQRRRAGAGRTVPRDGTSSINAFNVARHQPEPDQILLVTDGLPTRRRRCARRWKSSNGSNFDQSLASLPARVPVSTILMPMEGDVPAPAKYWRLARETGGVFMMPARDWP